MTHEQECARLGCVSTHGHTHPGDDREDLSAAFHNLRDAMLAALHLEQIVTWLDRQLRRWPWMHERLCRPPGRIGRAMHAVLHPFAEPLPKR